VRDFFISYNREDRAWAEWIAWTLEEQGRTTVLQAWHFRPGSNFVLEMQKAASDSRQTIMVLSPAYLAAEYTQAEWAAAFAEDPRGEARTLIPVRVATCKPVGLLRPIVYIDLVGLSAAEAASALVDGLKESGKPETKPAFPGAAAFGEAPRSAPERVPFPGSGTLLPRQLPSPPGDFVGRAAELATLRAAAEAGGPIAILGLRGMGGVGKTALALQLASELAPRYPDGQIFLELQGVVTGGAASAPLSPGQAMAHAIRAFLPEARLPEDAAELGGLYRTVLQGRRVLLLMDNAAGSEQVEPLLPPAGCALLVTSRAHFHLPGAATQDLGELPEPEARELLLGIAPRIGQEAGEISRLCGRLPFALRLAGSALADRPDRSPTAYAQHLAQAESRFGPVDASLEVSLALLSEAGRRRWPRLAVFPQTFDLPAAAAVWETEADAADEAMGELMTASLVEWEAGRYRLHDLARLFACGRLDGGEEAAAELRHAEHYLEVLLRVDALYLQGGSPLVEGLRTFDLEWPNIQAGQAWAAAHSRDGEPGAALCADYPGAGIYCLNLRLHSREQIRWREAALAAARSRGNRHREGVLLGSLGIAYAALGEPCRAIEHYEQHLAIAREIGDRHGEGATLGNLGNAYAALGEPRRAMEHFEQHLAIAREIGDRHGEGATLGNLGNVYADLGEPRRAMEHFEQHLAIAREIGDRHGEGAALGNLGGAYAALGEPRRAMEHFEQHLAIAREIGDRRGEGAALGNLGNAYAVLGEPRRAIEHYEQHLAIAREIGDRRGEGNALGNLGVAYAALGEPRRAIEHYEQRLAIAREIGDRSGEGGALGNLGIAYAALGEPRRAIEPWATWASPTRLSASRVVRSSTTSRTSRSPARSATAAVREMPWATWASPTRLSASRVVRSSTTSRTSPSPARSATGAARPTPPGTWAWSTRRRAISGEPSRSWIGALSTSVSSGTPTPRRTPPTSRPSAPGWQGVEESPAALTATACCRLSKPAAIR
jgi:tetratricopeptide (TPR) repeat protein